jgi:hypothetical protein
MVTMDVAKSSYVKVGSLKKNDIYAGFIKYNGPHLLTKAILVSIFCEALNIK